MRIITLFVIGLTLLVSGCATICRGGWDTQDTVMETTSLALLAADQHQTQQIASQPGEYYETNPILGSHPTHARVNIYFAGWSILHPLVACALPPKERALWQTGTIVLEGVVVTNNSSRGLRP